jgi:acyl-CoA reductase-like NAD-dependent aldehyde dehydrogenase
MTTETSTQRDTVVNTNPATGEVLSEHHCATAADVHEVVLRARAAQPSWAALSMADRVGILRRFQRTLNLERQRIATTISEEAGKPVPEALLTEVMVVLDATTFCAENAVRVLRSVAVPHGNPAMKTKRGYLLHEPLGVIGIISPWNYPFSIPATETLAALVTGNAVVLKPSEMTPLSALALQRLLREAGVPKDVMQVVIGYGETGAALIESNIDKLIFTGSVPTGKRVAQAAAARLLPVVLELGGKDPMLVLDDANVDVASSAAVWGALMNAGQTCLSVERCYVHGTLHDSFVAECASKIAKLTVGNAADPKTEVGPLISERQLQIVESQVEEAISHGARLVTGGKRLPELGPNFYAPTLLTGVSHQMRIMREETFGPVLCVMPFGDDDEAVRLANDSEFGLAASIFTGNSRRGEALARRLEAGTVMVNDVVSCFGIAEAPHGGLKASGLGRTHGLWGMREMIRSKYVDVDRLPKMKKTWWYGYGEEFSRQMDHFVELMFGASLSKRLRGGMRSASSLWRKRL